MMMAVMMRIMMISKYDNDDCRNDDDGDSEDGDSIYDDNDKNSDDRNMIVKII